jgi:3-deoxy-D-manno-octulosonate 8-phosphate phosphatase (KDO 8-P phosphatase)
MDLKEIASKIKLLAFDVDGVMTDGSITYDENGIEYKTFNAKDGHGLAKMAKSGFITAIITGRNNGTVDKRATDLRVTEVYQGVKNKLPILEAIMQKYELDFSQVAYMGDDEPDIQILEKVALSACPADAVKRVKNICKFISEKDGGRGAVRDLCDLVFDANREE